MSNLDWRQHDKAIVDFVRSTTDFYLRTDATTGKLIPPDKGILLRNNFATPRLILKLLNYLQKVTDQVEDKLSDTRTACMAANMDLETCVAGSTTFMQIWGDYGKWEGRFAGYRHRTEAAMNRDPDASGDTDAEFWKYVTKPLLLGLYPDAEEQKTLDAVTPLILAWQIEVAEDAYTTNLKAFWEDVKEAVGDIVEGIASFGVGMLVLGMLALGLGYGYARGKA